MKYTDVRDIKKIEIHVYYKDGWTTKLESNRLPSKRKVWKKIKDLIEDNAS